MKQFIKNILGIRKNEILGVRGFIRSWRKRLGPYFYKDKFSADDVVAAMSKAGMTKGSTILIQSSWGEFYNCTDTPNVLIEKLMNFLGPEGTLCMASMPYLKKDEVFDVRNSKTKAGYLAECFRKYPGVKRSIHCKHSVCAIGQNADYILEEHHLGDSPFDEKSPYYKVAMLHGKMFGIGLGPYWVGSVEHCVEDILRDKHPYYKDMWMSSKEEYKYIDQSGNLCSYWNYKMAKMRVTSYFLTKRFAKRYLHGGYAQISNLQICCYDGKEIIEKMSEQALKGHDTLLLPLKIGYSFK